MNDTYRTRYTVKLRCGFHLQVSIDIDGENKWKPCFTVDGVRLPTGYYFGASAATGDLSGMWT